MRVQAYRDIISQFVHQFASLKSAATPAERFAEAAHLRRVRRELMAAGVECRRATAADRERAASWLESAARYLVEAPDLNPGD